MYQINFIRASLRALFRPEVMNKNSGSFLRLKENEEKALHECLTWGSLPGNNAILRWQRNLIR